MLLDAPSLIHVLLFAVPITALVNVTIDDELGDSRSKLLPQYIPGESWAQGAQCTGCSLHPGTIDVSQAVNGTWHDATYHPGPPDRVLSLSFHGVAVYVFNIVPNSADGATTLTNLSFFLDHAYAGEFTHVPDQTANIAYHVPVFTNRSLPDAQHTLDVRATGPNASLVLFDCAVYSSTADGNNSSTSPSSPDQCYAKRAGIVGGALAGSVGGVIAIVLLGLLCGRRCRKSRWDAREGDMIEQTQASALADVPVLPAPAADELRPHPYPPPSADPSMASSPTRTGSTRAGVKGHRASGLGPGANTPSQAASNLPSISETGRSDPSVQEDLAAIRQEIARLREQQHGAVDSLPPPYE